VHRPKPAHKAPVS